MAPSSSSSSTATSVQVALRIRPPTTQESSIPARFQRSVIQATSSTSVSIEPPSASLGNAGASVAATGQPGKKQVFTFDQVLGPPTSQYEMFESTAKPLIARFTDGFNCTILAYGQTSSGKTFTMSGIDLDADPTDPSNGMGIIPRAVANIFARANYLKEEKAGAWTYNIKASFIEIYNEDLIDLLSLDDLTGSKREVQIREDKDGHIIWGGLREVNVRNTNEVMGLLRKGTSIRRTNETDMNAQSSRSHAIFSLNLTQKKYTGSGPPPRSSSPMPPGGRSPSRLTRPGSMYASPGAAGRVSSPPLGRPSTPSFASAMSRGGLRPASALGHSGERSHVDDDSGEWVTITSKFHFVDLAGSERLKRTAAQGERIKEGISINSGLLALGNVISALGDPARAKSHTASYVPYRDSKLTRLLQDSLGGNAHTLMIACVSPAEWNAGETINTLKYANRARNIKNRAVVNEKEDGWDDVEWLQTTVMRLRKDLKALKDGGALPAPDRPEREPDVVEGAGKKMIAQMTELQNNYEDLRQKFVDRTEELTRLRRELGERHRISSGGALGGTAKYEEIVGPVIEEYEKTISAMEAELSLNRAALRHTNEMVEEKEEELSVVTQRHVATELYVEELRTRVVKLSERESSTEAYIRDLEEKLKAYDDTSVTSSESLNDLRREVARYRDTETRSSKYITDLEARLARSDESILNLQQTVETLESECERRHQEVESLQSRLAAFTKDGESWRTDLEERERRVKVLEEKMLEWEKKKDDANDSRVRLGQVVDEVVSARKSLEIDLAIAQTVITAPSPISESPPSSGRLSPMAPDASLEAQLLALQQTHTATLADLSSVTAKYRDALNEISDLAAQIQEAKLAGSSIESVAAESLAMDRPMDTPPPSRRRMTGARSRDSIEPQPNSAGRRLFFRQAASAESLHSRSLSQSQSLSQELSSVHSRKTSLSSHSSHSPSNSHSTYNPLSSRPTLSVSLPTLSPATNERSVSSLEKEIMRLQDVLKEREAEILLLEESLRENQQRARATAPTPVLEEKETMFGENGEAVNGDRSLLDATLSPGTLNQFDHIRKTMENGNGHALHAEGESSVYSDDEPLERLNELMLSMAQKESLHREVVDSLNTQLSQTRRQLDEMTTLSRDQALNMSKELEMLRGSHEDGLVLLEQVQRHEAELLQAVDDAKKTHALELEQLRTTHEEALRAKSAEMEEAYSLKIQEAKPVHSIEDIDMAHAAEIERLRIAHEETLKAKEVEIHELAALQKRESELLQSLEEVKKSHASEVEELRAAHEEALRGKGAEVEELLAAMKEEHQSSISSLRAELEASASTLQKAREEHEALFGALKAEHSKELQRQVEEADAVLKQTRDEYEKALTKVSADHAIALRQKDEDAAAAQQTTEEEYYNALTKLRGDHAEAIKTITAETASTIERLREEHVSALKMADIAREGSVSASESSRNLAIQELQDQHAAAIARKDKAVAEELETLKSTHLRELSAKDDDYGLRLDRLRLEYETTTSKLNVEWRTEVERLTAALSSEQEQNAAAFAQLKKDSETEIQTIREHHALILQEVAKGHDDEVTQLKADHETELQKIVSNAEAEIAVVCRKHEAAVEEMTSQHLKEIGELSSQITMADQRHQEALKAAEAEGVLRLEQEGQRHASELEKLGNQLAQSQEGHQTERHLLVQELEAQKAAADEFTMLHQQATETHERELGMKDDMISTMQQQLANVSNERDDLEADVSKLRAELAKTRGEQSRLVQEASKRESLVVELERHRSVLAEMQENLQKVKDEKDVLQTEKNKSDSLIKELQAQVARSASPPNVRSPDRGMGFPRNTLPSIKLPPPTPPPTVPPPPAPRGHINGDSNMSTSSHGSSAFYSSATSSRDSQPDSPSTSVGHVTPVGANGFAPPDPKITAKLEEQAKQIEEQEAMIKTLNKQLMHCESDLQTHMDLVNKFENSLGDAEKNLRKARMQATELARERDTLNVKIEQMRNELADAQREVVTVRRSVVEEKHSLEQRLDEERKAKERARQQLDSRMEELQRRKSKFACL